jgi:hypothetical protein
MTKPAPTSGAGFLSRNAGRSIQSRAELRAAQRGLSDAGTQLLLSRLIMPSAKAKLISKRKQF